MNPSEKRFANPEYMEQRVRLEDLITEMLPAEFSIVDLSNLGGYLARLGKAKGVSNPLDCAKEWARGGHIEFVASLVDNMRFPLEEECGILKTAFEAKNKLEQNNADVVSRNESFIIRIQEISEKAKQIS